MVRWMCPGFPDDALVAISREAGATASIPVATLWLPKLSVRGTALRWEAWVEVRHKPTKLCRGFLGQCWGVKVCRKDGKVCRAIFACSERVNVCRALHKSLSRTPPGRAVGKNQPKFVAKEQMFVAQAVKSLSPNREKLVARPAARKMSKCLSQMPKSLSRAPAATPGSESLSPNPQKFVAVSCRSPNDQKFVANSTKVCREILAESWPMAIPED